MSPRAWIVAAQTAAVGALVVVAYVTLLRPEDPGSISGIEAPDRAPSITQVERRERGDRPRAGRESRRRRQSSARNAGTALATRGGVTVVAGAPAPPGAVGPAAETPAGDQYTDSAKALLERVAAGASGQ